MNDVHYLSWTQRPWPTATDGWRLAEITGGSPAGLIGQMTERYEGSAWTHRRTVRGHLAATFRVTGAGRIMKTCRPTKADWVKRTIPRTPTESLKTTWGNGLWEAAKNSSERLGAPLPGKVISPIRQYLFPFCFLLMRLFLNHRLMVSIGCVFVQSHYHCWLR